MTAETHEEGLSALEAAADWLDRLDELSPAERGALHDWLAASELNARAFAQMRGTMGEGALAEAASQFRSAPVEVVRRAASPAAPAQLVLRLRRPAPAASFWGRAGLVAAALAGAAAVFMVVAPAGVRPTPGGSPPAARPLDYATAIGVRSDATLSDRSVLHLNADSKVRVLFSDKARDVRLERGEAMFDVTHDPARPFDVAAAGATVTAVGTLFDVELLGDAVEVRVFRGVVKVAPGDGPVRFLRRGEWMTLRPDHQRTTGRFDPDLSQSWRSDWLLADNMPLKDVVARLNRYSNGKIVLTSSDLSDVELTGRFNLSRTDATLSMMSALLNLDVSRDSRQVYLSARSPRP